MIRQLGFRTMREMVGHVEVLDTRKAISHWKAKGLDISPILAVPQNPYGQTLHQSVAQNHELDAALDQQLIAACGPAIERGEHVHAEFAIKNVNRTVGTMLGNAITKQHGGAGLPDGTVQLTFKGSAGQSFGAFVPKGVTMVLEGDANDYVGKGLSGGHVVVRPDRAATFVAEDSIIAGNVIGYGATAERRAVHAADQRHRQAIERVEHGRRAFRIARLLSLARRHLELCDAIKDPSPTRHHRRVNEVDRNRIELETSLWLHAAVTTDAMPFEESFIGVRC